MTVKCEVDCYLRGIRVDHNRAKVKRREAGKAEAHPPAGVRGAGFCLGCSSFSDIMHGFTLRWLLSRRTERNSRGTCSTEAALLCLLLVGCWLLAVVLAH